MTKIFFTQCMLFKSKEKFDKITGIIVWVLLLEIIILLFIGTRNSIRNYKREIKSGFFDLPTFKKCEHPEHNTPTHIYIPQGKGYKHVCPNCGNVIIMTPSQTSL